MHNRFTPDNGILAFVNPAIIPQLPVYADGDVLRG